MEAPLEIRAWTLLYSLTKALAEPVKKNNDNRPRLFFYNSAYTTIDRYRTGVQLSEHTLLSLGRILTGNTRLIQVSQVVNPPVAM